MSDETKFRELEELARLATERARMHEQMGKDARDNPFTAGTSNSEAMGYIKNAFLLTWIFFGFSRDKNGFEATKAKVLEIISKLCFVDFDKYMK